MHREKRQHKKRKSKGEAVPTSESEDEDGIDRDADDAEESDNDVESDEEAARRTHTGRESHPVPADRDSVITTLREIFIVLVMLALLGREITKSDVWTTTERLLGQVLRPHAVPVGEV